MREMGSAGYPPALIDEHVRCGNSLRIFFGESEDIIPKRNICRDDLPGFRGYTHIIGSKVDTQFVELMSKVAEIDHKINHKSALEQSGFGESSSQTSSSQTSVNSRKRKRPSGL
jgi:hypothetical protein